MPSPTRRELLGLLTTGTAGFAAGCGSLSSDEPRSEDTESKTTEIVSGASAPSGCPEGYTPIDPWWLVVGPGPHGGFTLRLDRRELEPGATLVAHVVNTTNERRQTGNKAKFDIQRQHGTDWRSIYGMKGRNVGFYDDAVSHAPGEGFTYRLEFTEQGLSNPTEHHPPVRACTEPRSGTYRFVYWGITTEQEVESGGPDRGLSREFSVT